MRITRLPTFLQPEIVSFTSIERVAVDGTVELIQGRGRPIFVPAVVTVALVPLTEGPVVDVALEPIDDVDDRAEYFDEGAACSAQCGYCGRCC